MSPYDRLLAVTAPDRAAFLAIPVIAEATRSGVPLAMYLDFLGQAYHHVKHTGALLSRAAARCDDDHAWLQEALLEYCEEERGHELWILDDIAALGGDVQAISNGQPRAPCATMVRTAADSIDAHGPVPMLGMIHVLEGISVLLAEHAAAAIRRALGMPASGKGFRYLTSHGALDRAHVAFFATLVNRLEDPAAEAQLAHSARTMYRLYGDIYRDIAARAIESGRAA